MSIKQKYADDVTGFSADVLGSDGRGNVSARADSRGFYNSRDRKQTYSASFDHTASANGQYSFYFKNTSPLLTFVLSGISVNSNLGANVKLWRVSGTAANGVVFTPVNLNLSASKTSDSIFIEDGGGTPISGLTQVGLIEYSKISIDGHEHLETDDRIRLSQNEAIALEMDAATSSTPHIFGTMNGFFEANRD